MNIMVLALLAAACAALAIWLWLQSSKLQDEIKALTDKADKAEAESRAQAERADGFKKRYDQSREVAGKEDKGAKEFKAQAATAKEEVKRLQALLKKTEAENHDMQAKLRKAESRAEELSHALAERSHKKPAPVVEKPAAEAAPPPPAQPQAERVVDEATLLRRAELEAERAARVAEAEAARTEREAARAARQDDKQKEFIDKLKAEREGFRKMIFERELALRVLERKTERTRQAYIVTMGALDLAEDELYRLKHGRERPEYVPNRAGVASDQAELAEMPDAEEPVEAPTQADREAAASAAPQIADVLDLVDVVAAANEPSLLAELAADTPAAAAQAPETAEAVPEVAGPEAASAS